MTTDTLTNHEAPSDPFQDDSDGRVHTTSHLRMWGLTALYHYQVVSTGLVPRSTAFGGVYYTRAWALMPPR